MVAVLVPVDAGFEHRLVALLCRSGVSLTAAADRAVADDPFAKGTYRY